ncbi:MAG: FG-GAP-like repeat-containing protein [bacterium]
MNIASVRWFRALLLSIAYVLGALGIVASGGGGGGGGGSSDSGNGVPSDPLASLPYTGLRTAATIDTADIGEFLLSASFDSSLFGDLVQPPAVPRTTTWQPSPKIFNTGTTLSARQSLFSETGLCGGIAHYDFEVNDSTGEFDGIIVFEEFDDCEIELTGTTYNSGQINLVNFEFVHLFVVFELLEATDDSMDKVILSGKFTASQNGATESIDYNMRIRDEASGKVYWFDGYQTTVVYDYDPQLFAEETINTGRFYDPDRGYIDLSTPEPVRTYLGDAWPSSGEVIAMGAMNASARMTFLTPVVYHVEVDEDNDGIYEYDTGRLHYPGANTLPVADAGADTLGNIGCTSFLDGSNSSDADLDNLEFDWTIVAAPIGSISQLTNASSSTPSFTPDLTGNYQVSLSVFDGYDLVVDTMDFTSYGDLFCLADKTVTPYALSGQYEADVAVGDVTSDGRDDVLALTREAELYVFRQNPSGGLADPVLHAVDNWRVVVVGDVTGDGKNDAVVTTDFGVGVLAQDNNGELEPLVEYLFDPPLTYPAYTYALTLGDFDGDARTDAAVLPEGGPVYVFLQQGDGTLGAPSTYETLTNGWSQVVAGDVTGDGLTDLVLSRANTYGIDNIAVLPQDPVGGFSATTYYTIGNLPYTSTFSVVLGDLNGDNNLDLGYDLYIGDDQNSEYVGVLEQSDTGVFESPVTYNAFYPPIHDMAVTDFTGDGLDDLVLLHGTPHTGLPFSPSTVAVMAATGTGSLAAPDIYPILETPQFWGGIAVGDLDHDGKNDIALNAHGCDDFLNCGPYLVVLFGEK